MFFSVSIILYISFLTLFYINTINNQLVRALPENIARRQSKKRASMVVADQGQYFQVKPERYRNNFGRYPYNDVKDERRL